MPALVATSPAGAAAEDVLLDGTKAISKLKSSDPPLYLSPSEELSKAARLASAYLFSSLKPYTPKSPFSELLIDGFDAEQIWQQIDLQSQPLISSIRRKVRNFENNPESIRALFNLGENAGGCSDEKHSNLEKKGRGFAVEEGSENDNFVDDEEMMGSEDSEEEDEDEDGDGDEDEDEGDRMAEDGEGVEDKFFKIKELEEFVNKDEAREYGLKSNKEENGGKIRKDDSGTEEDKDDDEDDEDDDELGINDVGEDDGSEDELGNARYDDFFGTKRKTGPKRKLKPLEGSDDSDMDDEPSSNGSEKKGRLSTHEKGLERLRSTIEEMEKANLEPKTWTMQGEVTAFKRPKNSALEVDLDFEHNVRPAPVITEQVTASLEEIIQKRILEGHFDDVQKPPTLPSRAPKQVQELDENKSKKNLTEIYEEEYVQKTGLVSTVLSLSDQQKKEAANLFKELCLKLDALSHFHFAPKPVIEDMSIQANVPALAMEEIAPLAVSDAAMLAPEEVFAGKGDVKEEKELTKAERKRRRAKKKRKFKAIAAKRSSLIKVAQREQTIRVGGGEYRNLNPPFSSGKKVLYAMPIFSLLVVAGNEDS
ncbi:OLC1v1021135C2 [Oldenlandia corymbosa var. corymbosa]|nr:OLC1v1021135C2 [Oldenlandia corymbosa var. corymbosa]